MRKFQRPVALVILPSLMLSGCVDLDSMRLRQDVVASLDARPSGASSTPIAASCLLAGAPAGAGKMVAFQDRLAIGQATRLLTDDPIDEDALARSIASITQASGLQERTVPSEVAQNPVIVKMMALSKLTAAEATKANHQAAHHYTAMRLQASPQARQAMDVQLPVTGPDLARVDVALQAAIKKDGDEIDADTAAAQGKLKRADFTDLVTAIRENLLRTTTPKSQSGEDKAFWNRLKTYYSQYAQGKFVDYFGNQYAKPTVSMTVTDVELANTVTVFLEFLFDEARHTPVWKDSSTSEAVVSTGATGLVVTLPDGNLPTKGDTIKIAATGNDVQYFVPYTVTKDDNAIGDVAKGLVASVKHNQDLKDAGITAVLSSGDPSLVTFTGVIAVTGSVSAHGNKSLTIDPGKTSAHLSLAGGAAPHASDVITIALVAKPTYITTYTVGADEMTAQDLAKGIVKTVAGDKSFVGANIQASTSGAGAVTFTGLAKVEAQAAPAGGAVTYYPGGTANRPTFLAVQPNARLLTFDANGCGMTKLKAEVMNALAQGFASGASNATGAAVGTLGGIDIGLLVMGKISIGDNKALTSALEAMVSEIVARLTIEAAYPVLTRYVPAKPSHESLMVAFKGPQGS